MPTQPTCSDCGAALTPEAVGNLCAQCLMGLAMNPEASAKTAPGNRAPETPDLASILAKPASPLGLKLHCFGDYELLEEIAHGGMGDTNSWRAVYVHTNTASPIVWAAPATNGLQFYRARRLP